MSDLRARIAAMLIAHPDRMDGKCCRPDVDEWHTTQEEWAAHVADAVIREFTLALGEAAAERGRRECGCVPIFPKADDE